MKDARNGTDGTFSPKRSSGVNSLILTSLFISVTMSDSRCQVVLIICLFHKFCSSLYLTQSHILTHPKNFHCSLRNSAIYQQNCLYPQSLLTMFLYFLALTETCHPVVYSYPTSGNYLFSHTPESIGSEVE